MTAVIAYLLAKEISAGKKINLEKILLMSIFHDFHESRTGDVDKISTFYLARDEAKANANIFANIDPHLHQTLKEYESKQSLEAKIVYEANILAVLVELKQLIEKGNTNAVEWLTGNAKRIRLPEAIKLADSIMKSNTQDWWKHIRVALGERFSSE